MQSETEKLTPAQQKALAALLTHSRDDLAAQEAGISVSTLWRWRQTEAFKTAYDEALQQALASAIGRLQTGTVAVVDVLIGLAADETKAGSVRVSAARSVLEYALKGREVLVTEERLTAIEATLAAQETTARGKRR